MSVAQIVELFPALSVEDTDLTNKASNTTDTSLIKDPLAFDNSLNYPFLNDPFTIDFIKTSKVMFISRGLPGSGKSTLTKRIQEAYGPDNTTICSGDDFFTDSQGNYKFQTDMLSIAHAIAQKKALDACVKNVSPVVVDNTNVQFWELKPYLETALKYNYIVVIIEPRTKFKFDSKILFSKNKHDVPRQVIEQKLKQFSVLIPYYFGWFLNEASCEKLRLAAETALKLCFEHLTQYRTDFKAKNSYIDPFRLYEFKAGELHCTTKYIGGKKQADLDENRKYYEHSFVAESIGRANMLQVIGFCIGQSTISAIVSLKDAKQKFLWKNGLSEKERAAIKNEPFYRYRDVDSMLRKLEYGAHAHITLALANGVKAKQAVNDLVDLKLRVMFSSEEKEALKRLEADELHELIYLNELICFVKLKTPVNVSCIFSGNY